MRTRKTPKVILRLIKGMEPTDLSFWNVITLQVTFFAVCTTNYFKTLRESAGLSMGSVGVPFLFENFCALSSA